MSGADKDPIILSEKNIDEVIHVLKKLNMAPASYLSKHYIDASPQKIGQYLREHEDAEKLRTPNNSRVVWGYNDE